MSVEEVDNKVNGDTCIEIKNESDKEFFKFNPRPQRVLRLNRRGFYMSGHNKQNVQLTNESANSQKATIGSLPKSAKCETFQEKISPANRIIKLKNSVSTDVKRTLNGDNIVTSSSDSQKKSEEETPPKKKHKPITWP